MSALVEALLLTEPAPGLGPGIYAARAQDPAYGFLEALVEEGLASYLGEKHEPDGSKYIAVAVPGEPGAPTGDLVPNGSIRIGREFFTTALRDYHDWQEKWWREAVQNAVDAGARNVQCRVEEVPEGFSVSCADDGRGMDEDTLLNKFLVLGGTTKTVGDTRGGFGKAKELLVLPWLAWSVHTRDRKVVGVGIDYTVEPAPYREGTEVRVVMPPDQTTHASAAIAFLEKCNLPGIAFTVDGNPQKARLSPREELRSFGDGKATLYYDKKSSLSGLLVRTMGLFMFEMYVSSAVRGVLVVELHGPSIELLTANRDGFRDYALKRSIEEFVSELAADVTSALKKKKGLVREKFEGTGKFVGATERELRAEILNHVEELQPAAKTKRGLVLSGDQREIITTIVHRMSGGEGSELQPDEVQGKLNMRVSGELAAAMLDATVLPGPTAVEAAVKQLAWEPDFYLINETEDFHVPKMFYPDGMTPGIRKLARTWAELCRFVLIQLGCSLPFGVGFIFETGAMATYMKDEAGDHWLLLNPFRNPRDIGSVKPSKESLYGIVSENDVNEIYASAIHEATHMADGISYHDESFASALTRNVAKTANKDRQVKAIVKSIRARVASRPETRSSSKSKKETVLPPLRDEWTESRRRQTATAYGSDFGTQYVSFKEHAESVWDYDSDLDRLIRRSREETEISRDIYMEIRDAATGRAIWRSPNFPDSAYAAN